MKTYEIFLIILLFVIICYLLWERFQMQQEMLAQFLLLEISSLHITDDKKNFLEEGSRIMKELGEFFYASSAILELVHEGYGILPDSFLWENTKENKNTINFLNKKNFSVELLSEETVIGRLTLHNYTSRWIFPTIRKNILNIVIQYLTQFIEKLYEAEKLYFMSYYDHLTALPNRIFFLEKAKKAIADSKKTGEMTAVIFFDLDTFKNVNDTLGHEAGNELLKGVALRLCQNTNHSCVAARFGGDEYLILLKHITHIEQVVKVALSLLELFKEPFLVHERNINITASIGIALCPHHSDNIDDLLNKADQAMYAAKTKGKNQYVLFSPEMIEY